MLLRCDDTVPGIVANAERQSTHSSWRYRNLDSGGADTVKYRT
jgi:hypothetical protein